MDTIVHPSPLLRTFRRNYLFVAGSGRRLIECFMHFDGQIDDPLGLRPEFHFHDRIDGKPFGIHRVTAGVECAAGDTSAEIDERIMVFNLTFRIGTDRIDDVDQAVDGYG